MPQTGIFLLFKNRPKKKKKSRALERQFTDSNIIGADLGQVIWGVSLTVLGTDPVSFLAPDIRSFRIESLLKIKSFE